MNGLYVVDCSQVMAFLLGEEDGGKMEALLLETEQHLAKLSAPALLGYEVNNVLTIAHRKGRIDDEERVVLLQDFFALPIELEPVPTPFLHQEIGELAKAHTLTAYDASYLELGLRKQACLRTLDQDLLKLQDQFPDIFS